jgi:hypothetical protein
MSIFGNLQPQEHFRRLSCIRKCVSNADIALNELEKWEISRWNNAKDEPKTLE